MCKQKHIMPCSSERAETRVFRRNVSIFFFGVFGGEKFFQIFLGKEKKIFRYIFFSLRIFLKFYLQLSAVISLGRFRYQALPDLWSPRVWFTFRNKKVRRIKVVLKIEGHYNFIFREKKMAFFREKKKVF